MNLRNIPQRWSSSLVAVLGIGGVTLVLMALLSIAAGFKVALEGSGSEDVAIIMRAGSTNELSGGFGSDTVTVVSDAPGIKRDTKGGKNTPILSPELYVLVDGTHARQGRQHQPAVAWRGAMAPQVRKSFKIVEGRMFREGTNEIIVGDGVVKQYEGLESARRCAGAMRTGSRRPFHRWRRHRRIRGLGRRARGAAGLAPRQQLSVDSRAS